MENRTLTIDRFQTLADAHGGDLRRWPDAERAAALALAEVEPAATAAILTDAAALDRLLTASPNPTPSLALRNAILAAAPRGRTARRPWVEFGLGASLAAAAVAGVMAGIAAAPIAAPHFRMQTADTASEAARWLGEPSDMSEG